jgi:hypothetical protein
VQGLLGLAFHPSYASNGRSFVNYIDNSGTGDDGEVYVVAMDEGVIYKTVPAPWGWARMGVCA